MNKINPFEYIQIETHCKTIENIIESIEEILKDLPQESVESRNLFDLKLSNKVLQYQIEYLHKKV